MIMTGGSSARFFFHEPKRMKKEQKANIKKTMKQLE